jgi:hypothetical protein
MMELFPELKDYSDMNFREPCKKTRGRFKASSFRPDPLEPRLRAHLLYRDRIRRHVRAVADASLRIVPSLLLRLAPMEEKRKAKRRDSNRHLYLRMRNLQVQQLSDVRVAVMKELVKGSTQFQRGNSPHPPSQPSKTMLVSSLPNFSWTRSPKATGVRHGDPRQIDLTTVQEAGYASYQAVSSDSTSRTNRPLQVRS